ncbi:MAG: lysoplasmalogenase [Treponema sp.]|jgi:uncharacterized membrane protein YhhN|nr:lysoplasmalogenase [Treponema sp.]
MDLKIIFLVILGVVSVVYLVTLFFKYGLFQAILKGCLVPLILAVYIFGAEKILLPVVLALVFGWAGDVLLLKGSNFRFFILGLVSFLIGHICYIIAMFGFARPFHITVLVISIAVGACIGFLLFKILRPTAEMKIPIIAYEITIITMAIFALQLFRAQNFSFGAFVLAGSLCFLVSDSTLAYDTFRKGPKYSPFIIMLTYIAAQLLITLGFCNAV